MPKKPKQPTLGQQRLGAKLGGAMLGVPQWRLNSALNREEPKPPAFVPPTKGKGRKGK
jgi:hypothetical protein